MKRSIYQQLLAWKKQDNHKPLLIRGARQIGKTYIIKEFGNAEFKTLILLNFERNPEYKDIFSSFDPKEIIEKIIIYTGQQFELENTLIFLDEIQDCPRAIMALRYLYEEMPDLHVIGAGSLLEFTLNMQSIRIPVGRIQYMYMYPLSFGEFLMAINEEPLFNFLLDKDNLPKISKELHEKLLRQLHIYFIIGGMPEVVSRYIQDRDVMECKNIQLSIIETYQDDFGKYSSKSQYKYLQKVFKAIPSMVGNKLIYSKIDKSYKSRDLKAAFDLLETAGVVYRIKKTSAAGLPLEVNSDENYFKPLFLDIGLLHAISGDSRITIADEDLTAMYKGSLAEQYTGQELIAMGNNLVKNSLYYWAREARNSNAEIDYLVSRNNRIVPIEVKYGKKGKLKSLLYFLDKYNDSSPGLKISQEEYSEDDSIISLPLYAIKTYF